MAAFFTESLAKEWYSEGETISVEDAMLEFINKEDENWTINVNIYEVDSGIEIEMDLSQY